MSENTETKETEKPTEVATPSISPEIIAKIQSDAAQAAREAAASIAAEKTAEAIAAQNARIRAAMGDAPQVNQNDELLRRFFEDPASVLSVPYTKAKAEGKSEAITEIRAELAREKANAQATHEVLSQRPDIFTNEGAMKLISAYWAQQDPNVSPKEQLKAAVKEFDLQMEKAGAGDSAKRVAAAASITKTAGTTDAPTTGGNYKERSSQANASWQEKRVEEYRKKHGGEYPGTIRR